MNLKAYTDEKWAFASLISFLVHFFSPKKKKKNDNTPRQFPWSLSLHFIHINHIVSHIPPTFTCIHIDIHIHIHTHKYMYMKTFNVPLERARGIRKRVERFSTPKCHCATLFYSSSKDVRMCNSNVLSTSYTFYVVRCDMLEYTYQTLYVMTGRIEMRWKKKVDGEGIEEKWEIKKGSLCTLHFCTWPFLYIFSMAYFTSFRHPPLPFTRVTKKLDKYVLRKRKIRRTKKQK